MIYIYYETLKKTKKLRTEDLTKKRTNCLVKTMVREPY